MRVRKAVIPVAGLGTRFLPVTKSVPKELLPVGTKPTLQLVIEEAASSGIEEVILVTSPNKEEVAGYFQNDAGYGERLAAIGKGRLLDELRSLTDRITIITAEQDEPRGLGHAILCAKKAVGMEPFMIMLPDVLIESNVPCSRQLIGVFEKIGASVNATEHTPRERLCLYGVYDIEASDERIHKARGVVEKPDADRAPSDLAVVGRYLFTPEIFDILEKTLPGRGGEIQLADAMDAMAKMGRMFAYEYDGMQFDTGEPLGLLKANIYYGRRDYPDEIDMFMRGLLGSARVNK